MNIEKIISYKLNVSHDHKEIIVMYLYEELSKLNYLYDDSNYRPEFYFAFHFVRDMSRQEPDIKYIIDWCEGHIVLNLIKAGIHEFSEIGTASEEQYDEYMYIYDMKETGNECDILRAIFSGFLKAVIKINKMES